LQEKIHHKKLHLTSYWRNGGLREKLKVSPFLSQHPFIFPFFINLENNKRLLLRLVQKLKVKAFKSATIANTRPVMPNFRTTQNEQTKQENI